MTDFFGLACLAAVAGLALTQGVRWVWVHILRPWGAALRGGRLG